MNLVYGRTVKYVLFRKLALFTLCAFFLFFAGNGINAASTPTKTATIKAAAVEPVEMPFGTASAKRAASAVVTDGNLNEKDWSINAQITESVVGESNNKASFGLLWDDKYLYVGVKVTDNKLVKDSSAPADDDCIEIFFDTNNNHFSKYDIFDSFYKIGYNRYEVWERYGKTSAVKQESKAVTGGYTVEVAFPWDTIFVDKPKEGKMLGIDIGIIDDDDMGNSDSTMMWCGGADNDRFSQNFGDFYLNNIKGNLPVPEHPFTKLQDVYNYKNYYEYVNPGDNTKIVRLWVPDTKKTVRGVLILGNPGNGDARELAARSDIQAFVRKFDFGLMTHAGISGGQTYSVNGAILLEALNRFAKLGFNPELKNVPFVYQGGSSGGASSYGMVNYAPERTICFTSTVTATFNPAVPNDKAIKVPGMFTTGEYDRSLEPMRNVLAEARERGALWSWNELQGAGHEYQFSNHMYYPFWEKCIKLRYPPNADPKKGPVKLNDISESSGWLADESTWKSGFTRVYPYGEYPGDKAEASWLLDKDMAYNYRGLATWYQRLILEIDNNYFNPAKANDGEYTMKVFKPGNKINLVVDDRKLSLSTTGWTRLEFYMGSKLIGEVSSGQPTEIEYTLGSQAVAQVFSVVAYDKAGNCYTSNIAGLLVV